MSVRPGPVVKTLPVAQVTTVGVKGDSHDKTMTMLHDNDEGVPSADISIAVAHKIVGVRGEVHATAGSLEGRGWEVTHVPIGRSLFLQRTADQVV